MTQDSPAGGAAPQLLEAEDFEPLVGREARFGDIGFPLTLAQVDRARRALPTSAPRQPFTLIFSAPGGETYLMEDLYRCDFGDGATVDIHVAPIYTADPGRQDYQAIFN